MLEWDLLLERVAQRSFVLVSLAWIGCVHQGRLISVVGVRFVLESLRARGLEPMACLANTMPSILFLVFVGSPKMCGR